MYRAYEDYIADSGQQDPEPKKQDPKPKPKQDPEPKKEPEPKQQEPKQDEDPRIAALENRLNTLEKWQSMIDVTNIHPKGLDDVIKKFV